MVDLWGFIKGFWANKLKTILKRTNNVWGVPPRQNRKQQNWKKNNLNVIGPKRKA